MNSEKIISIKKIGKHQTIDLEVNNLNHTYFANNILVSNSHAISYATNSYTTCFLKFHFKTEFFTSALYHSKNAPHPQETIRELVNDLKNFNVKINNPNIKHLNANFKLIDGEIYFGILNIKNIGASVFKKVKKYITSATTKFNKKIEELTWLELVIFVFPKIGSSNVKALISAGTFSHIEMTRKKTRYENEKYNLLCGSQKTKDQKWIEENYTPKWTTLIECLTDLTKAPVGKNGGCSSVKRLELVKEIIQSLKSPPYSLADSPVFISEIEEFYLGIPLVCSKIEECNIEDANATCQEFLKSNSQEIFLIACEITRKHEIITKNNKKMCFLTISDISGEISGVVFPEQYKQFRPLLYEKNDIMVQGKRGREKDSLIVNKIYQL